MRFRVQATVVASKPDGWTGGAQVPTFYLDGDVQGITECAHAARVAHSVIDTLGLCKSVHIAVWDENDGYASLDA